MKWLLNRPNGSNLLALTLAGLSFTVAFAYVFSLTDRPLAPATILDLEFAGSAERMAALTAAWGQAGTAAARLSLWADYLFMPVYVALASGLTLLVARASAGRWQGAGLWLTLAPLVSWACDAVENVVLLNSLPPAAASTPLLAASAVLTTVKFGLLAACVFYIAAAAAVLAIRRLRPAR